MTDAQNTFEMLKAAGERREAYEKAKRIEPVERYISWQRRRDTGEPVKKVVPEIDAFLADIFEVFEKHKMSISHEDHHGGFEIEDSEEDNEYNRDWLNQASDAREVPDEKSIFKT